MANSNPSQGGQWFYIQSKSPDSNGNTQLVTVQGANTSAGSAIQLWTLQPNSYEGLPNRYKGLWKYENGCIVSAIGSLGLVLDACNYIAPNTWVVLNPANNASSQQYRPDYHEQLAARWRCCPQSAGTGHTPGSRRTQRAQKSSTRRVVSLHQSVLLPLHRWYARKRRNQHRNQPSRFLPCEGCALSISTVRWKLNPNKLKLRTLYAPVAPVIRADPLKFTPSLKYDHVSMTAFKCTGVITYTRGDRSCAHTHLASQTSGPHTRTVWI